MLDALRAISALLWFLLFLATLASATRNQFGRGRERDGAWTLVWFVAFLELGWGLRYVAGLAPSLDGPAYDVTCALNTLSIMIAGGLLMKRFQYEGFRW